MTHDITPDLTGLSALALEPSTLDTGVLAEAAVTCQDTIAALRLLERVFCDALGKADGKHTGNTADGRQYELRRAQDRKEWDHEDWQRDVRRKVTEGLPASVVLVDVTTGEDFHRSLEFVVSEALIAAQQVHGAGAPRARDLRSLGLYANDYCTSSPAGWRLQTVRRDQDAGVNGTQGVNLHDGDAAPVEPKGAAPGPSSHPAPASLPAQREAS